MTLEMSMATLLAQDEPPAHTVENPLGTSPCLILCDHAGARIPRQLQDLGVSAADRQRHIAWDLGAAEVARMLGRKLDACVILQTYSRLVIDCNRPPGSAGSIVTVSEDTPIPGNVGVTAEDIARREREIFQPYHQRIRAEIDARRAQDRPAWLICLHSFTPVFRGVTRRWHTGVLYNRDPWLAHAVRDALRAEGTLVVGDNEPYAVSDTTDYAIPVYGEALQLPHVGIEIRQDLIGERDGQEQWAERLGRILTQLLSTASQARGG